MDYHQFADDMDYYQLAPLKFEPKRSSPTSLWSILALNSGLLLINFCWMQTRPKSCSLAPLLSWNLSWTLSWNVAGSSLLVTLGVILDSRLSFDNHVTAVCRACNYHIWALRHIRRLLPNDVARTLACSIVITRLDYCDSLMSNTSNRVGANWLLCVDVPLNNQTIQFSKTLENILIWN